jgi:hypothetical protein
MFHNILLNKMMGPLKGKSHEKFLYFFGIIRKLGSFYTFFILSVFKNIFFVSNLKPVMTY